MPKSRRLTTIQAFTAPVAIAQDHGLPVSLDPHPSGVLLRITRPCSPARISLASVFPPADPTQLVADIQTHCGYEIAVETIGRRWTGGSPIGSSELRAILDSFTANGFDAAPYHEIEEMWRSGSELEAALILLRWTALMYEEPDGTTNGPARSRLVARQAERLVAAAESSLDDVRIRRRIDRLAPVMMRAQPMTELQLRALTADLRSKNAFARLDWPWLTQRMAARSPDGRCASDDRPSCTSL